MQFAQLRFFHHAGRPGQQALRALGLGEGDDVADALGPGHQRGDAVEAESQAAVLTLRHSEQLNIEQIAGRLKISSNLVRVRLFRAYERLRASPRLRRAVGEA